MLQLKKMFVSGSLQDTENWTNPFIAFFQTKKLFENVNSEAAETATFREVSFKTKRNAQTLSIEKYEIKK